MKSEKIPEIKIETLASTEEEKTRTTEKKEMPEERQLFLRKNERKQLITIIIVIAILLAIGSGTFSILKTSKAPQALPVDELHDLNKQGKLSAERGYMYHGNSIVLNDGLWWSDVILWGTTFKVPLHFGPRDVENINFIGQTNSSFNDFPDVYIAINPETADKFYTLAISELSLNLAKIMNRAPVGACTKENENVCFEREIVSCAQPNGKPIIELDYREPAEIKLDGACIKITGQGYNLTKSVDRLLYRWYGIME